MSALPTLPHPTVNFDVIPEQMRRVRRWILWRDTAGRKRPFTVAGSSADSTDPATWSSFADALAAFQSGTYTGLGFVLGDGFAGIDLDDVRNPETGYLHSHAQWLIGVAGSYAEVSPSGTGVKIFGAGLWAGFIPGLVPRKEASGTTELRETSAKNRRPFADGEIEVYCDQRYFTVTGQRIGDGEFRDLSSAFEVLREQYSGQRIPEKPTRQKPAPAAAEEPTPPPPTVLVADVNPLLGDDQIIAIASRSKNGPAFVALWNGDLTAYNGDQSNADLTLCQYLAFYTHNDPARIDRLFRRSKLFREKWERSDYRNRTISLAISSCRKFWDPSNAVPYDNPHRLAERFIEENPTLKFWRGDYLVWCDGCYQVVEPAVVRGELVNLVKREFDAGYQEAVTYHASQQDPKKKPPALAAVTVAIINNVIQALNGLCSLADEPPCWIGGMSGPDPVNLIAFRNGILDVATGQFFELTPSFFTLNAVPYAYDPNAPTPVEWLKFLDSIWGDDPENISTLQEWFGYCLVPDNRYQKIVFMVGPTRSGKGTILRTLESVVGGGNTASSTLANLAGAFGLEPLIGKHIAVIPDARFGGDRRENVIATERILSITGGDLLPQDRKHRSTLFQRLLVRFTICSNEIPELRDASAAIAERFIVMQFTRSFLGVEDTELSDRIAAELPGLFLWSLEGLRRLRRRGRFIQPRSGAEHKDELRDLASPVGVFFREECTLDADAIVPKRDLYDAYLKHAAEHGCSYTLTYERFGKELGAVWPGRKKKYPRVDGKQIHAWSGIRLKTDQEKNDAQN